MFRYRPFWGTQWWHPFSVHGHISPILGHRRDQMGSEILIMCLSPHLSWWEGENMYKRGVFRVRNTMVTSIFGIWSHIAHFGAPKGSNGYWNAQHVLISSSIMIERGKYVQKGVFRVRNTMMTSIFGNGHISPFLGPPRGQMGVKMVKVPISSSIMMER